MRPVTVAQISDGQALIDSGLEANEKVVVDGQYRLQPGSRVQHPARQSGGGGGRAERGQQAQSHEHLGAVHPAADRDCAADGRVCCCAGWSPIRCCRSRRCRTSITRRIQVTAQLPGADPQTMASSVATPLEQQFGQIPGVTQLTSASALGVTQLTVQFDLEPRHRRRGRATCWRRSMRRARICRRTSPIRRPSGR